MEGFKKEKYPTEGKGEKGRWITVNGSHIFVEDGQSVESAMQETFAKNKNNFSEQSVLTTENKSNKIKAARRELKDFQSLHAICAREDFDELIQKSKFAFFSKGREDLLVKPLLQELGFDGLPQIVNESTFNELKRDHIYLCRGVTDKKHVKTFANGDMFVGLGVNGSGVYTTTNSQKAWSYAKEEGGVIEMLLDKNAKVGDGIQLFIKAKELMFSLKNGTDVSGNPINIGLDKEQMIKIGNDNKRFVTLLALSEGYDAINVGNGDYIILNRTACIIKGEKNEQ